MKTCLIMIVLLLPISVQAENWRLVSENLITSDSDDADQRLHLLGAITEVPSIGGKGGVWLGRWQFDEPVGSEDFSVLRLSYDKAITDKTSINSRVHVVQGDDWSPTLASFTGVHRLNEQWRFEGSVEKGWIDSVSGLRQELGNETFSVSADWRFAEQWTAVAALLTMSIDDGNQRDGGVLRFIYELPQIAGLNLQTRSKLLRSDFNGIGYFSPPELQEHLLLIGYSRAVLDDRWVLSGLAGAGTQQIETEFNERIRNDLYYIELKARGWFNDHAGLESRAYCSNTGGPNFGTPDDGYRYCNLLFSVIGSF